MEKTFDFSYQVRQFDYVKYFLTVLWVDKRLHIFYLLGIVYVGISIWLRYHHLGFLVMTLITTILTMLISSGLMMAILPFLKKDYLGLAPTDLQIDSQGFLIKNRAIAL